MAESSAITTSCMNREAIRPIPQVQYFQAGRSFWRAQLPLRPGGSMLFLFPKQIA
jgi:hypothetical protein